MNIFIIYIKLLILTGPTGCGKSTSIRLLAKSMDYDIIEWSNHPQISHTGYHDPGIYIYK